MKTMTREAAAARWLGACAAAIALIAALPASAQDKVQLQLNWFHLADHSPIYLAMKKGYYKEENIELTVLRGSGSADSAKKIDLGQAEVDRPTRVLRQLKEILDHRAEPHGQVIDAPHGALCLGRGEIAVQVVDQELGGAP